ncbi:MAG: tRNA lysidine(34) synthetase TilS [Magnetovibrionaceae bacterium]
MGLKTWAKARRRFDRAMAAFGPFEAKPLLAVGFSGGSDSMALVLLARAWAKDRGGRVITATVDHQLRIGSTRDASRAGRAARSLGLDHDLLAWEGPKPVGGLQARAREARYRLLESWAAEAGALHLLLGHTADDQAETRFMRARRARSGPGLTGMSALVEQANVRLLRPLLDFGRQELRCLLLDQGHPWLDDPANRQRRFERVRIRSLSARPRAIDQSALLIRLRSRLEAETARWLARRCQLYADGALLLSARAFSDAVPEAVFVLGVSRALMAVGGGQYAPSRAAVTRLAEALRRGEGWATLGGVRIAPHPAGWIFQREKRNLPPDAALKAGETIEGWDGRFFIANGTPEDLSLTNLEGHPEVRRHSSRGPEVAALPGLNITFRPYNTLSPKGFV